LGLVKGHRTEHHPAVESKLEILRKLAARAENRRTETGIPRVAMVKGEIPEHELAALYDPILRDGIDVPHHFGQHFRTNAHDVGQELLIRH
jgi:hypothetical protein